MAPEVETGERLLSLEMEGNNLITHWGSLRPRLNQEAPETGICFTKNE
jgi:hypothetical protein